MKFRLSALLLMAAPVAALVPLQTPPAQAQTRAEAAYADLASAMIEQINLDVMLENAVMAIGRQFSSDPMFLELEEESPGLIDELLVTVRPILAQFANNGLSQQRAGMEMIFARHLNAAEAGELAQFYRSPIGSKILGGVSKHYSFDEILTQGMQNEAINSDTFRAAMDQSATAAAADLTAEEQDELANLFKTNPALRKLAIISPELQELKLQIASQNLTPAEEAAMNAAMTRVFERRFGT